MRRIALLLIGGLLWAESALAVPETASVRITDVTPTSFAVVWLTDVAAEPAVQLFRNADGSGEITGTLRQTAFPEVAPAVRAAARGRGIMKVRVTGIAPQSTVYVRTVTADPANPQSVSYSALQKVVTATRVEPFRQTGGALEPSANDLLAFPVYIRPGDPSASPGLGDLLLLESPGAASPLSAFVGEGLATPEGLVDLNNLFGPVGTSLDLGGGETATLRHYRGGTLATLLHYRLFPADTGTGAVNGAVRGFFADLNLDGKVDEADFELFRPLYRQRAEDSAFNPDYNVFPVSEGATVDADRIDAQDFARFAGQFGRTDVPK